LLTPCAQPNALVAAAKKAAAEQQAAALAAHAEPMKTHERMQIEHDFHKKFSYMDKLRKAWSRKNLGLRFKNVTVVNVSLCLYAMYVSVELRRKNNDSVQAKAELERRKQVAYGSVEVAQRQLIEEQQQLGKVQQQLLQTPATIESRLSSELSAVVWPWQRSSVLDAVQKACDVSGALGREQLQQAERQKAAQKDALQAQALDAAF